MQDGGLDFGDGGIPLLDLRFADDILLFATSSNEAARMLDALVACLKEVGLELNASKTKILTTQAQPGKTLRTQKGLEMEILDATKAHKWLGCLLSTSNAGNREADLDFRLQATSKAFYANKWILCDKNVSLNSRIKFFDSVVTSVVRFGAGNANCRWSVLELVNANCINLSFGNLMCTAVNFYVKSLGHQEALIGLNRGTPCCINGTNVSWNKCN